MPVTKTAKRALRSSKKKGEFNKTTLGKLEVSVRIAKKSKKKGDIENAISFVDRGAKKSVIHKNKAARIKKSLQKLSQTKKVTEKKKVSVKSPRKTKKS